MKTTKMRARRSGAAAGALSRLARAGETAVGRLRRDAKGLVGKNSAELKKALGSAREDVLARVQHAVKMLDRAVSDVEKRLVKQFHVATEAKVGRLERRVAKLEQTVARERRRASSRAA